MEKESCFVLMDLFLLLLHCIVHSILFHRYRRSVETTIEKVPSLDDSLPSLSSHLKLLEEQVSGAVDPDGSEEFPVKSCRDIKLQHPHIGNGKTNISFSHYYFPYY